MYIVDGGVDDYVEQSSTRFIFHQWIQVVHDFGLGTLLKTTVEFVILSVSIAVSNDLLIVSRITLFNETNFRFLFE